MKLSPFILIISFLLIVSACKENPARMPVSRKTGTFLKESVSRNKDLIAIEEAAIDSVIKGRPDSLFQKSQKGYQYKITKSNPNISYLPQVGDVVTFDYQISTIYNEIIYTRQQLGRFVYKVDKQDLLIGLQDGIKRLKAGEEATFYFPSHLCYGYKGDDKKIGTNYPLKIEVFVEKVEKQKPQ
jgi:gliding motility-associated peptidyl-prolyl isomerase